MKINLGVNKKRYTRDMSFDNNTTFGFGEVQPLMSQLMMPNSDIHVSAKQLIRLSPLIAPSFARVNFHAVARFVPIADVYAPFESMLSNIPYSTTSSSGSKVSFIPSSVPNIPNNFLLFWILVWTGCSWSSFNNTAWSSDTSSVIATRTDNLYYLLLKSKLRLSNWLLPVGSFVGGNSSHVSSASADFVAWFSSSNIYTFRFSSTAKRMRKILIGLGYDLSLSNNADVKQVSILPLLAWYKAYFETYYPTRDVSWTDTSAFALIDYLSHSTKTSFDADMQANSVFYGLLSAFLFEVAELCWYSQEDDYVSIHTSMPLVSSGQQSLGIIGGVTDSSTILTNQLSGSTSPTGMPIVNGNVGTTAKNKDINDYVLKGISVFSKYLAKDSIIGKRMSSWVRQHFNADIANQLFKDSNFVGKTVMPLQISDVFSTAETASSGLVYNTGEHLGAYAGKGIGYGNMDFRFHASVHGYFIILGCIAPVSGFFQGYDHSLGALTRFDFPTPEFDGLGYEVTDSREFIPLNNILSDSDNSPLTGFGYVPRYTGFKYRKNIVNGDMSSRSGSELLMPYYLDRIIVHNVVSEDSKGIPSFSTSIIPRASVEWRFPTKYGYLGNFNRLFYDDGYSSSGYLGLPDSDTPENFIGQFIFDVKMTDFLKPLKSSFDTFDEDNDNDVKSVNAE